MDTTLSQEIGADDAVVVCANLTKVYAGGTIALRDLTLTIERGMSFGLLGENGAGKSTLVRLLMGFILPTQGSLSVLGEQKVSRAHPRIGYLHERPAAELRMTGRAYLTYMAQLAGYWGELNRRRVSEVLELVGLSAADDKKPGSYSKGMLQRLCIAQALLTEPEFLILDEPTSGLDPASQWEVRQVMNELRQRGKTLLICSHYLNEVEMLCDTIGILQRGRLIQHGAVQDLVRAHDIVEIVLRDELNAGEIAERLRITRHVLASEHNLLRTRADEQQAVLAALVQAEIPLKSLNPQTRSLEDVYIQATRPASQEFVPAIHAQGTDDDRNN